ncbi:hypothetical protein GSI_08972 [Ganoderma sinense ZZ0214-1]|uniref:AAA+ ATPase domain-containing protein n=1 Tax=Ganoderma sinense ZZ0214-1 TaxID=1077348 RepID=A0A2G8S599_9APHY|nr:hypothetical protein GSI_08972 [Ganoderma sinense ZZ0214-1]
MASTNSSSSSDVEATTSTVPTPATTASSVDVAPLNLDVKFVDSRWDEETDSWKYNDTANPDIAAELVQPMGADATDSDSWEAYCFVVVRKHSKMSEDSRRTITFEIVLKSPYLITACQSVMADVRGVSWTSQPINLDPKMLIAYFPRLEAYEQTLSSRSDRTDEDERVLKSLGVLLAHMRKHYRQTLARIATLVANREITFDLLYAVLLPGTVIIRRCPVTRETRALKLLVANQYTNSCGQKYWSMECEYLECTTSEDEDASQDIGWGENTASPVRFGMSDAGAQIRWFDGVEKISSLSAFPIEFHPDPSALKSMLLERARKWVSLCGMHHVHYQGNAGRYEWVSGNLKLRRYSVRSRIMVDKAGFSRIDADYDLPNPERMLQPRANADDGLYGLIDAELLLTPPIVYGFSLSDKLWLEFNVNHVAPIEWNDEAFAGLVLSPERKDLLRGLIEAHGRLATGDGPARFDDFVRGKGQGLVINLFGPPGVGKTLSAEATSEHLRRPLYIVGSGDLGTSAGSLDNALREAFELAAAWRAVLLIDEADVFLEQRSLHDLERNAMVAVFLRHVEYYRGILFMTTNRIRTFDEAFLSRIHVALHFEELSVGTKVEIWRAFLRKAGLGNAEVEEEGLLARLAEREVNGRQIKNACRTATALAVSRGERMGFSHLEQALNAMEEFMTDFAAISESH